jgi:hypothetical protein
MGKEKGKQNGGMRKGHQNGNRSKWEDDSSSSSVTSEGMGKGKQNGKMGNENQNGNRFKWQMVDQWKVSILKGINLENDDGSLLKALNSCSFTRNELYSIKNTSKQAEFLFNSTGHVKGSPFESMPAVVFQSIVKNFFNHSSDLLESTSVTSDGTTSTRRSSKQVAPFTQAVKFGIQFVRTPDTDKISEARALDSATKLMSMNIEDLNDYKNLANSLTCLTADAVNNKLFLIRERSESEYREKAMMMLRLHEIFHFAWMEETPPLVTFEEGMLQSPSKKISLPCFLNATNTFHPQYEFTDGTVELLDCTFKCSLPNLKKFYCLNGGDFPADAILNYCNVCESSFKNIEKFINEKSGANLEFCLKSQVNSLDKMLYRKKAELADVVRCRASYEDYGKLMKTFKTPGKRRLVLDQNALGVSVIKMSFMLDHVVCKEKGKLQSYIMESLPVTIEIQQLNDKRETDNMKINHLKYEITRLIPTSDF